MGDNHGWLDHQNFESMNSQINEKEDLNAGLRQKSRSVSSDSDEDGRSKRLRPSPESNSEDGELQEGETNFMNGSSLLGLTLKKTPSFLNLLEAQLSKAKKTPSNSSSSSSPCRVGTPASCSLPENQKNLWRNDFAISSEKLKASNFPALKLTIGQWERVSKHESDLIAKCYYAKRKLVWEILDGALKNKIEIQWTDIIAIKATIQQGDPGILEIELNQPPNFYRETNPQPRKHTLWQETPDFTGGQAPIYRRHCVIFPPGILDKHYEKLLHYDARLNELSKQPFPSQISPYFESENPEISDLPFDNNYGSQYFPNMHQPFDHLSASSFALLPNYQMLDKSAVATPVPQFGSSFPLSGGSRSNYAHINQSMVLWGQGQSNLVNVAMGNQSIGMLPGSTTPQANWVVPTQDHEAMYLQNDYSMRNNQDNAALDYIKNHLLSDNQVASSNDPKLVANVDAVHSLLEHHEDGSNLDAAGDVHGLNFGYQTMNNFAQGVVPNNGLTYAEPYTWGQTMAHSANPYPTLDANRDV
ncbi:hypothetical protein HAX54_007815 [Datura stramonium]|uniref:TRF2/HOY1 PH-like domain-containing protein n=1 Tax=Datura stramonium TaxID=4076 RepID=A0ABS8RI71_DATST|nr:hypothetical protein [Datura stramonium]